MRHTHLAIKAAFFFSLAHVASISEPAFAQSRKQFNQPVELRVINQPVSAILQSVMQGRKVSYQVIGDLPRESFDWRFKGSFASALRQLSREFGLCIYSDGARLFVVSPRPGESLFVRVDAPLTQAVKTLRSSFPWYSANAVRVDQRSNALHLCGPASFLQPTVDALKSWEEKRLVIIR